MWAFFYLVTVVFKVVYTFLQHGYDLADVKKQIKNLFTLEKFNSIAVNI